MCTQLYTDVQLEGPAATELQQAVKFAADKFATNYQFQKMENYFTAMTDRELLCFVKKFRQLLSDGNMAKLVMECESGCVRVNFQVHFQPAYHPHPQEQQHPQI